MSHPESAFSNKINNMQIHGGYTTFLEKIQQKKCLESRSYCAFLRQVCKALF